MRASCPRPKFPARPSYPNRQRIFLIIAVLGFLGACGLVVVLHLLNPGMFSPEQIEQQLGVHTIGLIPMLQGKEAAARSRRRNANSSGYVEAINSLKISLKLSDPDTKIQAIQVTSSVPEEGKTSPGADAGHRPGQDRARRWWWWMATCAVPASRTNSGMIRKGPGLTDFVIAENDDFAALHHCMTSTPAWISCAPARRKYVSATDLFAIHRMHHVIDLLKDATTTC